MTYQVVGYSKDDQAVSAADLVLDGLAFRRSLVAPEDSPDSVASIGSTHTILSEIKDRVDVVFEGSIKPMKLARRLVNLVASRRSGRLIVWDLDHGADYFFRLESGFITTISTSRLTEVIGTYLADEGLAALDWRGPMVADEKLRTRLVGHIGCDDDTARSVMGTWSIAASLDVLEAKNVLIGWLEPHSAMDVGLRFPFGNFIRAAFQRSTSDDELKAAVNQIKSSLVPNGDSDWHPWYPTASTVLMKEAQQSFAVAEVLGLLSESSDANDATPEHYATVLTLIAAGYFSQHTSAPSSEAPVVSEAASKKRKLPKNYYRRLRVDSTAMPGDIRTAHTDAQARLDSELESDTISAEEHADLSHQYEVAYVVLSDRMMRRAFDQAREAKVDFVGEGLEARLLSEYYRKEGNRALHRRGYAEAHRFFLRSSEYESTLEVLLMLSWSDFLNGDQNKERGDAAIAQMQSLGEADTLSDMQCLYMGKVARLSNDRDRAKTFLNQAVTLNDKNQEAWGELRLLNTKGGAGGGGSRSIVVSADTKDPRAVFLYAVVCLVVLYCCANLLPSDRAEWPEAGQKNQSAASGATNQKFDELVNDWQSVVKDELSGELEVERAKLEKQDLSRDEIKSKLKAKEAALLERFQAERAARPTEAIVFDKTIPTDERVLGNVEYYHLADDDWFWMRRALLVVFGLIGIFIFGREDRSYIGLPAESVGMAFIAVPYGLVVGFLSAVPVTSTPVGTLLMMGLFTAVAECMFFLFFVARCLMARIEQKIVGALLATVLFGLYQFTYFATLATEPLSVLFSGVLQATVFAGGASAFALYKSKSVVPPLLLLLSVQLLVMLKLGNVL